MTVRRTCWTCTDAIECDDKPVKLPTGHEVVPKFNAPLICKKCRPDPVKFAKARKAMMEFFGWHEHKNQGVPSRELNTSNLVVKHPLIIKSVGFTHKPEN